MAFVHVDATYSVEVQKYMCPKCFQDFLEGLRSFIRHYRYLNYLELCKLSNLVAHWLSLSEDEKKIVRRNIYPILVDQMVKVGPMRILSERGLENRYNNCWTNAAFHILCGSIISQFLPSYTSCPTDVCKWLLKIRDDLQNTSLSSTPLRFTKEMKYVVRQFRKRFSMKKKEQDDAGSFIQELLQHLVENSLDDIGPVFSTKIASTSYCGDCHASGFGVRESVIVELPVWRETFSELSIQSLLYNYCINGDLFNSFNCKCKSSDEKNHQSRSYLLQIPTVLLIMTDRVGFQHDELVKIPLTMNETLYLDMLIPAKHAGITAMYRLAAAVVHHGRTRLSGHYNCTIFNDMGEGLKFDDCNQIPVSKEKYINGSTCRENCRMLVYVNIEALQEGKTFLMGHGTMN